MKLQKQKIIAKTIYFYICIYVDKRYLFLFSQITNFLQLEGTSGAAQEETWQLQGEQTVPYRPEPVAHHQAQVFFEPLDCSNTSRIGYVMLTSKLAAW